MRSGGKSRLRPVDVLALAAAPTFGLMGLLSAVTGDTHTLLCTQGREPSSLSGMTPMYFLMALFHLSPWFRRS